MSKPQIGRLLGLVIVTCLFLTNFARAEWDTYQGNPAHTGYVPGTLDASHFGLIWKASLGYSQNLSLAIGANTVVVKRGYYDALALDQMTGATLWSNTFGGAPAYANGAFYMQVNGHFVAYAARTGAEIFDAPYGDQGQTYLNPTPYQDNIYIAGGQNGGMYSFNATTGDQNWFGNVAQYDKWTPAVDENYCYTYTGSGSTTPISGQFRIMSRVDGKTVKLITDTNFIWTGYSMNSAVVLGSHANAFSINAEDLSGRLISWDLRSDATHTPHIDWVLTDNYKYQPTLANGVLYVNDGYKLAALDELSGQTLWTWSPPNASLLGTMIATDNLLFVTASTDSFSTTTYAVDLATHLPVWSFPIGGALALSDRTLYIAGYDYNLYAIAVPEPSTICVLAIGGLCLPWCIRLAGCHCSALAAEPQQ